MKTTVTERGFRYVEHDNYVGSELLTLIQECSAIGNYEDSMKNPGSSYLWFGENQNHRLNREEVQILIYIMQQWLQTKRIPLTEETEGIKK